MKECKKCGVPKINDAFYDNVDYKDGKDSTCKDCRLKKAKESNKSKIHKPEPWFIFDK